MVRYFGSPARIVHVGTTLTRSKVKAKVMGLLAFRKLPKMALSISIYSAILAWSSKLIVVGDSMAPNILHVSAQFSNFLTGKLLREFELRGLSRFHEIQIATFPYCVTLQSHGQAC